MGKEANHGTMGKEAVSKCHQISKIQRITGWDRILIESSKIDLRVEYAHISLLQKHRADTMKCS